MKNSRMVTNLLPLFVFLLFAGCEKDPVNPALNYYEVGFKSAAANWRDTSFIFATSDTAIIAQVEAQLALPVAGRKMVKGPLVSGSGGYNKNAGHEFK